MPDRKGRRTPLARGQPHVPQEDPQAPGCCRCGRRMDLTNDMHLDGYPPVDPDVAAETHRRLGEAE